MITDTSLIHISHKNDFENKISERISEQKNKNVSKCQPYNRSDRLERFIRLNTFSVLLFIYTVNLVDSLIGCLEVIWFVIIFVIVVSYSVRYFNSNFVSYNIRYFNSNFVIWKSSNLFAIFHDFEFTHRIPQRVLTLLDRFNLNFWNTHTHTHTHIYIYIYMYGCVCAYMCVCECSSFISSIVFLLLMTDSLWIQYIYLFPQCFTTDSTQKHKTSSVVRHSKDTFLRAT